MHAKGLFTPIQKKFFPHNVCPIQNIESNAATFRIACWQKLPDGYSQAARGSLAVMALPLGLECRVQGGNTECK